MVVIEMNISDLTKVLKGDVDHIDDVDITDVALFEDNVPVYPKDVKNMLLKYLADNITSDDLTRWAEFLCLRGEYGCPNQDDDIDEDFYEAMWDIVQALSAPEIDGVITKARVQQYLAELDKYKNE